MAKKPDVGSKAFSSLLLFLPHQPNKHLVKQIDAKMFSLDMNPVFNYKPELLAFHEYKRCLSLFNRRNPGLQPHEAILRIPGTQQLIVKAEDPNRPALQSLAIKTIKDVYQVPDYIDLKAIISPRIDLDTDQDHNPESFLELTLNQKNSMRDEIQKRIILNGLVHGSSMHVWKGIYHLVLPELNAIDPGLAELYDYYTSTLGLTLWLMDPKKLEDDLEGAEVITQGFNQLKFDRQKGFGGKIECRAINFPVMLHELNKGVIDWIISGAIPRNYNEQELKYYYSKADAYENEIYHYLLAPTLWLRLLETSELGNEQIPALISKLSKLTYQELVDLFKLILDGDERAKIRIKSWNI